LVFLDCFLITTTGYKARTHIAKSLQKRCTAIQNAVKTYNAAALSINPPQPTVDWSAVSHYSFIEEFALLRDTHQDIRSKRWAQPVIREMMKRAQRIARAHEEIVRCNVELLRLQTWICDEDRFFAMALERLKSSSNILYHPVLDFCTRRRRVNAEILIRIAQTQALDGFTGATTPGTRKGLAVFTTDAAAAAEAAAAVDQDSDSDRDSGLDDDDDLAHDYDRIMDFILTT
jgi:hypothetical protein